ncbi:MAG TPA: hypothetical protein VK671_09505 [Mucilaginibacter sp.]|nr:hypothetical protein [Mucilaginibacter sp.]
MNAIKMFSFTKWIIAFAMITVTNACSSHSDNAPAPPLTKAEILVNSGKWVTTGGTLVKDDGTSITLASNDPFFGTILLGDVTFYADGTAVESNDPNGLTANGLTWHLNGSNLLVNVNDNNTDKVAAVITFLSEYKLIMEVTDFYVYNGVTYTKLIQTLTH